MKTVPESKANKHERPAPDEMEKQQLRQIIERQGEGRVG